MKLTIIAFGQKLPRWVDAGFDDYARRMPPEARIELVELKPEERGTRAVAQILEREAARVEAALPKGALPIVLDERGKAPGTAELARWMAGWLADGSQPAFIIGSADGLDARIKQRAAKTLALSALTLPHGLARVLLAEQLYRAWSLLHNHPYHRE